MGSISKPEVVNLVESILTELHEKDILRSKRQAIILEPNIEGYSFVSNEQNETAIYLINDDTSMLSILYANDSAILNMSALGEFDFDEDELEESLNVLKILEGLCTKYTFNTVIEDGSIRLECTLSLKEFNVENISTPMRNFIKNWIISYADEFKRAYEYVDSELKN